MVPSNNQNFPTDICHRTAIGAAGRTCNVPSCDIPATNSSVPPKPATTTAYRAVCAVRFSAAKIAIPDSRSRTGSNGSKTGCWSWRTSLRSPSAPMSGRESIERRKLACCSDRTAGQLCCVGCVVSGSHFGGCPQPYQLGGCPQVFHQVFYTNSAATDLSGICSDD